MGDWISRTFHVCRREGLSPPVRCGRKVKKKGLPLQCGQCNNGDPRIALAKTQVTDGPSMIDKLAAGVVQIQTPIGPRYVMPSFLQRVYFLWVFRHFPVLPHAVLSGRQQRLIDRICSEQVFASLPYVDGLDEAPVIGTVERRPVRGAWPLPSRRPVADERAGLAAEAQQRP